MSIVKVTFKWDDGLGVCQDCGLPAAYVVPDLYGQSHGLDDANLMCAVCAAHHASTGERIVYLWAEEHDSDESKQFYDFYKARAER